MFLAKGEVTADKSHLEYIGLLNDKPKGSLKNTLKGGDLYAMELLIFSKEKCNLTY